MVTIKTVQLPDRIPAKGSLRDYYNKLKGMGLRPVGHGWYSEVYGNNEYVIKVARDDPAYDKFLEYALAHQNNPFMPKIYDVKRFCNVKWDADNWGDYINVTVVTMERLKKNRSYKRARYLEEQGRARAWPHQGHKKHSGKSRHETQALNILGAVFKDTGSEDLHKNNIMMRGEQVVIIDPVS